MTRGTATTLPEDDLADVREAIADLRNLHNAESRKRRSQLALLEMRESIAKAQEARRRLRDAQIELASVEADVAWLRANKHRAIGKAMRQALVDALRDELRVRGIFPDAVTEDRRISERLFLEAFEAFVRKGPDPEPEA